MVLGKHKEAVRDFQRAAKGAKSDPDLKRKLSACQKELQRERFAKAVSSAPPQAPSIISLAHSPLDTDVFNCSRPSAQHIVLHFLCVSLVTANRSG
jgi:hypothetical protein